MANRPEALPLHSSSHAGSVGLGLAIAAAAQAARRLSTFGHTKTWWEVEKSNKKSSEFQKKNDDFFRLGNWKHVFFSSFCRSLKHGLTDRILMACRIPTAFYNEGTGMGLGKNPTCNHVKCLQTREKWQWYSSFQCFHGNWVEITQIMNIVMETKHILVIL